MNLRTVLTLLAAAVPCMALLIAGGAEASDPDCLTFATDFDDDTAGDEPAGWVHDYRSGNVAISRAQAASNGVTLEVDDVESATGSGNSVRLEDHSTGHSVTLYKQIDPVVVTDVTFYAMIDEEQDDALNVAFGGDGTPQSQAAALIFWEGELFIRLGAVGHASDIKIGEYDESEWYEYQILIDADADTVAIWQDGVKLDGPRTIAGPGISDMQNVRHVWLTTKGLSKGTAWIDEFALEGDCADLPSEAVLTPAWDTYLKQGTPNKNQGGEDILRLRASGRNRALISFDITAVEDAACGRTPSSATLRLWISFNKDNWGAVGREVGVYAMETEWTELGATWKSPDDQDTSNSKVDGETWTVGGGDSTKWPYAPTPSDLVLHTNGLSEWVEFDVTDDILDALAGGEHLGWMVRKVLDGQAGHVEYESRLAGTHPPELALTFE